MKKSLIILVTVVLLGVGSYFGLQIINRPTGSDIIIHNQLENEKHGFYQDNFNTGFDASLPFASKYYFTGNEVDNFLWHQNHCFRIVNIAVNGHVKIVHSGLSENPNCEQITDLNYNVKFSDEEKNNWHNSNIKEILVEWENSNQLYDTEFIYDDNVFVDADWFLGTVYSSERRYPDPAPITLRDHVEEERKEIYQAKLGLITLSDYLKANEGSINSFRNHQIPRENYLFQERNFWTLTPPETDGDEYIYAVLMAKELEAFMTNENSLSRLTLVRRENFSFYPTLYLNGELNFSGEGTKEDPYFIE